LKATCPPSVDVADGSLKQVNGKSGIALFATRDGLRCHRIRAIRRSTSQLWEADGETWEPLDEKICTLDTAA
jgi:hypothetical protein